MSITGISKYAPMLFATVQKYRTFYVGLQNKEESPYKPEQNTLPVSLFILEKEGS
jgi:hypothetical protein